MLQLLSCEIISCEIAAMETSCKSLFQEKKEILQEMDISRTAATFTCSESIAMTSTHILDLPDSIILHILAYLPFSSIGSAAQVCRHWQGVCQDELLWRQVFLQHYKLPRTTVMPDR